MSDETDGPEFGSPEAVRELLDAFAEGLAEVVDATRDAIGAAEDVFLGTGDEFGVLTWLGRLDALLEEMGGHEDGPGGGA